ncbi:hypothetical protein [Streptomyces sp. NPDC002328]|uniref:hypothetical protein n=1 Tax=Streptomyces sp. NPDC002328 TaxID=3364642 RepID=UPI0036743F61
MSRTGRLALPAVLLLPLLLTACGTEDAGTAGATSTAGAAATADPADPADPAELNSRAQALGIAPEAVYAVEAPGYTLAQQSVGVIGDDGFSATYVSPKDGTQLQLMVDRAAMTADDCANQAPAGSPSGPSGTSAPCVRDGEAWYRSTGGRTEYTVARQEFVIRVGGTGVPRDVLREAAHGVHRPSADELDALLPPAPEGSGPAATTPVERGDLPSEGDGAPRNDVGVGG